MRCEYLAQLLAVPSRQSSVTAGMLYSCLTAENYSQVASQVSGVTRNSAAPGQNIQAGSSDPSSPIPFKELPPEIFMLVHAFYCTLNIKFSAVDFLWNLGPPALRKGRGGDEKRKKEGVERGKGRKATGERGGRER